MPRPGVSIVIPTRDRPDLLVLTLRSVLNQRQVDFEILVVDDGTRHETADVVKGCGDERVHLIVNRGRRGVGGARNQGLHAATREWVAFCDDDDLWAPDKLAEQLSAADREGAAWVYAGDVTVDADLRVLSGDTPPGPREVMRALPTHNSVPAGASNVVVRADALARAGTFDPELRTSEDWDLWLRLARIAGTPACVPRPLVALRTHERMASRNARQVLEDLEVIAHRYGIPVDRARHHRWAAWMALEEGRRGAAIRHYARAVRAGDVRSAARALVALAHPRLARHRNAAPPTAWMAEAQVWLDALRSSECAAPL